MPQYKKAFDIGTYTGNSGLYRVGIPTLYSAGPTGTQIAGSLRFRSANSNYITRTPGSAGNRKTWTYSLWFKRAAYGANHEILVAYAGASDTGNFEIRFGTSDQLYLYGWTSTWRQTTQSFKDSSAWNHLVISVDTTLATANDRIKIYVNGSQITSFASITNPTQNADTGVNSAAKHLISGNSIPDGLFYDGYLSQVYLIDGQALTPSSFGEYNSDGIWVPKAYSGTYGTNGFYLPMNSSSNYVTDQSGNGNNWTSSGFNVTTSNTTYDLVTDSPTDYGTDTGAGAEVRGNYLTLSSWWGNSSSIQDGGLTMNQPSTGWDSRFSPTILNSGKWYCEAYPYTVGVGGYYKLRGFIIGKDPTSVTGNAGSSYLGYTSTSYGVGFVPGSVTYFGNGGSSSASGTFTSSSIIRVAVDIDSGRCWMGADSTWIGGGNPSTNTTPSFTFTAGSSLMFALSTYTGGTKSFVNFGQRAFSLTAPTGFKAMNTANISRPADSSMWFYGDTPDFMWIKNRGVGGSNVIQDTVRGINLSSFSDTTGVEGGYPYVMEMNKFGMSLQYGSGVNLSGGNFVYWAWKAGSNTTISSVTNTSGTITSQVSANPSAGFSIVTFTGTGAAATVGHGLGAAPSMVMVKRRSASGNWPTYHVGLTSASYVVYLNLTNSQGTAQTGSWNGTAPTSTVFSLGSDTDTNQSGTTFVGYCWTAIPGYSAFGSFTGNGSTDGPFVYLGFRPRWVLIKSSSAITNWWIWDVSRNTSNVMTSILYPDLSNAEYSDSSTFLMDALSNGFKYRTSNATVNGSGTTYIYAAFAEAPFKYARAR